MAGNQGAQNAQGGQQQQAAAGGQQQQPAAGGQQQQPAAGGQQQQAAAGGQQHQAPAAGQQPQAAGVPVAGQDFNKFLKQDHDWRQADFDARQEQHKERLEKDEQFINWQKEQADRQIALDLATNISKCDGLSAQGVREWLRAVDLTTPYTKLTVLIAGLRSTEGLKDDIETYLNSQPDRARVTWGALKRHIEKQFLSSEEEETLKLELERMRQGSFENYLNYGRRYKRAADLAYPVYRDAVRPHTEEKLVVHHYLKGLKNTHVKQKIIRQGTPDTLAEVMAKVATFEAGNTRIELAQERGLIEKPSNGRIEEAMEVAAVEPPVGNAQQKEMCRMRRQMDGLTTEFTKFAATLEGLKNKMEKQEILQEETARQASANLPPYPAPRRRANNHPQHQSSRGLPPRREYLFTESGLPICNYCNQEGHIARSCNVRQQARQQRNQIAQSAPGGGQTPHQLTR